MDPLAQHLLCHIQARVNEHGFAAASSWGLVSSIRMTADASQLEGRYHREN
jgi:hypothetical protein